MTAIFGRDRQRACANFFRHVGRGLLLLGLLLACVTKIDAHIIDAAETDGDTGIIHKVMQVDYFVEAGAELNFADVERMPAAAWKRRPSTSASYGFAASPHWFKSEPLLIRNGGGKLLLEVGYPLLDKLELYVRVNKESTWQRWRLGDKIPFHERPHIARTFVVPVLVGAGDSVDVIARVETLGSMRFPLVAWSFQEFEWAEHLTLLGNGIFVGLMGGVFITNLIIFATVRNYVYLYYSAWILPAILFILSYNGIAFQYFWPESDVWNDWCRVVFMLLASGFFMSFTISFVSQANVRSWITRFHFLPSVLIALIAIGVSFLPFSLAIKIALGTQLVGTLLCLGLACVRAREGQIPAKIFLIAFSGVFIGAALHALDVAGAMQFLQSSVNFEVAPQIGSAFAVLLFSLALANRLQEERRHEAAAAEMKLANEALASAMRSEQKRASELLETKDRLRLEAERRDQDKSRFLADAVHDLRQPLQAIGNALDPVRGAIKAGQTLNALGLVEMATRAAANMRSQLAAILDLSRLDSGAVKADLSDFDLISLIREAVEQTRFIAQSNDSEIVVDLPEGKPVFVRSDRHFLQRILTNLISNGIKYRALSGSTRSFVRLSVKEDGKTSHISVQDNGIGIPEEILKSGVIFRPFFQLNNRHAEAEKGVGLGLSIVSAMLALLKDHKLSISSKVGIGSTFTLEIPSSAFSPIFESFPVADSLPGPLESVRGKYVIMVEDDALVLQTMEAVLASHGVLYEAWSSVEEMERMLPSIERAPDVLLSDYRLPNDRTALDAINLMAEHWENVPTLILTGEALSLDVAFGVQGTSLCYKPIAPHELLRRIAVCVARQAAPSNFGTL